MIRIAIVEDDKNTEEKTRSYIERYSKENSQKIEITSFSDGDEIIENYKLNYDIILMDVQMQFLDGITTAKHIRKLDSDVVIIFITNMAQYAIHGYEVNALDYMLKPVSYFAFSQKLHKAIEKISKVQNNYIAISINKGMKKIDISKLCYVESSGHILTFHMKDENFTTQSTTMKLLEEKLTSHYFYRCNKGYLVNLYYVDGIKENYAIVNGENILISRTKKNAFYEALTNYIGDTVK